MSIYDSIREAMASGRAAVLCTVVQTDGSGPRHAGAKMLVFEGDEIEGTVGGGAVEHAVRAQAMEVLASGSARLVSYDLGRDLAMACGGRMQIFIEPVDGRPDLILFGAGHVAQAVAPLAASLGFKVSVADDRREYVTEERFPTAFKRLAYFDDERLHELPFGSDCYVVILTYGHKHDERLMLACREQSWRYMGLIASRTKAQKYRRRFEEAGASADQLSRFHSPIGLDIGARTPAEIAVSIMGEIIAEHRGAAAREEQKSGAGSEA